MILFLLSFFLIRSSCSLLFLLFSSSCMTMKELLVSQALPSTSDNRKPWKVIHFVLEEIQLSSSSRETLGYSAYLTKTRLKIKRKYFQILYFISTCLYRFLRTFISALEIKWIMKAPMLMKYSIFYKKRGFQLHPLPLQKETKNSIVKQCLFFVIALTWMITEDKLLTGSKMNRRKQWIICVTCISRSFLFNEAIISFHVLLFVQHLFLFPIWCWSLYWVCSYNLQFYVDSETFYYH